MGQPFWNFGTNFRYKQWQTKIPSHELLGKCGQVMLSVMTTDNEMLFTDVLKLIIMAGYEPLPGTILASEYR